jgi:hypothetical protein
VDKPWIEHLVDASGNVTTEFGLVCAALVLLAWIGVAMQGATAHTTGALHRCERCRRSTMFQRRPGFWVPLAAGLSWGVLLWTRAPSLVRWLAPGAVWGVLVALHPRRCAICRMPMSLA